MTPYFLLFHERISSSFAKLSEINTSKIKEHSEVKENSNEVSEEINIGDPQADLRLYFSGETG